MSARQAWDFTFDAENRLIQARGIDQQDAVASAEIGPLSGYGYSRTVDTVTLTSVVLPEGYEENTPVLLRCGAGECSMLLPGGLVAGTNVIPDVDMCFDECEPEGLELWTVPITAATSITILEFAYDGLGRRVITRENGVGHWYVYDGDQLVQDRGERSDELLVEYTYGPTPTGPSAIFKQNRGGQERFFYTSPQGGFPRYAFDETGTLTDWLQYSAFGELVFHEASGSPTDIEVGWRGGWTVASGAPLPVILMLKGRVRIPFFGLTANAMTFAAQSPIECEDGLGRPIHCPQLPTLPKDPFDGELTDDPIRRPPSPLWCCPGGDAGNKKLENRCVDASKTPLNFRPPYDPLRPWAHSPIHQNCSSCTGIQAALKEAAEQIEWGLLTCAGHLIEDCMRKMLDPNGNPTGFFLSCPIDIAVHNATGAHPSQGCTNCNNDETKPTVFINCSQHTNGTNSPLMARTILHELLHACQCQFYAGFGGELRKRLQSCATARCLSDCSHLFGMDSRMVPHLSDCYKQGEGPCPHLLPGCSFDVCHFKLS